MILIWIAKHERDSIRTSGSKVNHRSMDKVAKFGNPGLTTIVGLTGSFLESEKLILVSIRSQWDRYLIQVSNVDSSVRYRLEVVAGVRSRQTSKNWNKSLIFLQSWKVAVSNLKKK